MPLVCLQSEHTSSRTVLEQTVTTLRSELLQVESNHTTTLYTLEQQWSERLSARDKESAAALHAAQQAAAEATAARDELAHKFALEGGQLRHELALAQSRIADLTAQLKAGDEAATQLRTRSAADMAELRQARDALSTTIRDLELQITTLHTTITTLTSTHHDELHKARLEAASALDVLRQEVSHAEAGREKERHDGAVRVQQVETLKVLQAEEHRLAMQALEFQLAGLQAEVDRLTQLLAVATAAGEREREARVAEAEQARASALERASRHDTGALL